jgi:hypothetical protein
LAGLSVTGIAFLAGAFLTGLVFCSGFFPAGAVSLAGLTAGLELTFWGAPGTGAPPGVGGLATKKGFLHFLQLA